MPRIFPCAFAAGDELLGVDLERDGPRGLDLGLCAISSTGFNRILSLSYQRPRLRRSIARLRQRHVAQRPQAHESLPARDRTREAKYPTRVTAAVNVEPQPVAIAEPLARLGVLNLFCCQGHDGSVFLIPRDHPRLERGCYDPSVDNNRRQKQKNPGIPEVFVNCMDVDGR
jgi:hypothetical protein